MSKFFMTIDDLRKLRDNSLDMRARKRVGIDEDGDIVIHVYGTYKYIIEKNRITGFNDVLDWVAHLQGKGWPNMDEVIVGVVGRIFGILAQKGFKVRTDHEMSGWIPSDMG